MPQLADAGAAPALAVIYITDSGSLAVEQGRARIQHVSLARR